MNLKVKLNKFLFVLLILVSSSCVSYAYDYDSDVYNSAPSYKPPYHAGTVRYDVLVSALNEVNHIRRLIGVPDVILNDEYTRRAQHGAVLLDVINTLTHTPGKPSDMNQEFYSLAYDATEHSNIASRQLIKDGEDVIGAVSLNETIRGYMDDSDSYNIPRLGHRRWLMNPRLKYIGFGISTRRGYASAYVIEEFGKSGRLTTSEYNQYLQWLKWPVNYEFITWPVNRTLHPLKYFDSRTAWSVTLNHEYFDECKIDSVKIRLMRLRDGKIWNFSKHQSDGYFNIDTSNIAYDHCIIFRPMDISGYGHNESWRVDISGLTRKKGKGFGNSITYNVTFIN